MIKVQNGVVGTAMDLLQHLYTTLRVGRMSRAEAIIQRLSESSHIDSPEVLHAHTAYLEELLRHLAADDLDLGVIEVAQDLGRSLRADDDEENGQLLVS